MRMMCRGCAILGGQFYTRKRERYPAPVNRPPTVKIDRNMSTRFAFSGRARDSSTPSGESMAPASYRGPPNKHHPGPSFFLVFCMEKNLAHRISQEKGRDLYEAIPLPQTIPGHSGGHPGHLRPVPGGQPAILCHRLGHRTTAPHLLRPTGPQGGLPLLRRGMR